MKTPRDSNEEEVGPGVDEDDFMPIYEYQCQDCGHQMDALQKTSDAPLQDCPGCTPATEADLSRRFPPERQWWYETDFKLGNKKNLAGDSAQSSGSNSGS